MPDRPPDTSPRPAAPPPPEAPSVAAPAATAQAAPPPEEAAVLTMLDGASPQPVGDQIQIQKAIASDRTRPLEERLEAFEDIIDSDVGDTILWRARNLERDVGLRQIYLKYEGSNPSGTQKDRIAFAQAKDAIRRGFDGITVATCGNYGASVALASALAGLRCVIYIPEGYHTNRLDEMTGAGAEILRVPADYENAVLLSRRRAGDDDLYDANPGGANTALQIEAYGEIANEIYDQLRDAPAAVAVPVSNGTTLAGIYKGFLSLFRRGKTSKLPLLVAGSSFGKNPITQAVRRNLPQCEDLDPRLIRETPVNEPLINWHSSEGDHALDAIRRTGGWADDASDKDMLSHARLIREKEGLNVLPASTAGLVVLLDRHRVSPLPGDRYVVLLTGRRT
jgi:threonine synthase